MVTFIIGLFKFLSSSKNLPFLMDPFFFPLAKFSVNFHYASVCWQPENNVLVPRTTRVKDLLVQMKFPLVSE